MRERSYHGSRVLVPRLKIPEYQMAESTWRRTLMSLTDLLSNFT